MSGKKTFRRTLWAKLFIMLLAFAALPGTGLAWWTLHEMREARTESTVEAMEAVVTAKAEAIERFMEYRRANVERIASLVAGRVEELSRAMERAAEEPPELGTLPELEDAEVLEGTESEGPGARREPTDGGVEPRRPVPRSERESLVAEAHVHVRRVLGLVLWDRSEFEELLVIDDEGRVLVSTFEPHEDRDASNVEYFTQGLAGTYLQPVFLSPITERYTMVVATPIYSEDREVVAVLAARLNLDRFFGLITETTGLGETGETIAAEEVGGAIILRAPARHHLEAGPGTELEAEGLPVAAAARGESGAGPAIDRRGKPVLAAWRHLEELGWGLVVKIDEVEAMRPVEELRRSLWLALLVVVVIAALVAPWVSGSIVRPLRQLRSAADRISRGDLGVSVDIDSRDEVGELAESFERMVAAIRFFRERGTRTGGEAEDEALQREIEAEAALQREEEHG